jgi:nucleoside diphosphate kinase
VQKTKIRKDTILFKVSLRALFGTDNLLNAVFGADSQEHANSEIDLIFGENPNVLEIPFHEDELSIKGSAGIQRTLCIINSSDETVRAEIISRILYRGIKITKREQGIIRREDAEKLFVKYGEKPIFNDLIDYYTKYAPIN